MELIFVLALGIIGIILLAIGTTIKKTETEYKRNYKIANVKEMNFGLWLYDVRMADKPYKPAMTDNLREILCIVGSVFLLPSLFLMVALFLFPSLFSNF